MGAERRRVLFRHALGDAVYLEGAATAYTVCGYSYTAWGTFADDQDVAEAVSDVNATTQREQRTYLLKPPNGRAFWIEERHLFTAPTRNL